MAFWTRLKSACAAPLLALTVGFTAGTLGGCDAIQRGELKLGASAAEVRAQMGDPETVYREADGRESWDYPRGPEGATTMRLTLSGDQRLVEMRNILTEANFAQIQTGMNKEDVRRVVGRPGRIRKFGNSAGGETWEWKYLQDRNTEMLFHADFSADGLVKSTGRADPALLKPQ